MDMTSRDSRSKGILTISLLFLAMTWPVILSGRGGTNEASDEVHYHLPMIQHFAEQWPLPPEDDAYTSATTPGYHYLMAGIDRGLSVLTGSDAEAVPGEGLVEDPAAAGTVTGAAGSPDANRLLLLRLFSSLLGLGLLLSIFIPAQRALGGGAAISILMPLLGSAYFLGSSIWLSTDNGGWLFASLAIGTMLAAPSSGKRVIGAALAATAAVFIRQIMLWCAAPACLAVARRLLPVHMIPPILRRNEEGSGRWLPFLAVLLPFCLVAFFAWKWGGLVPPNFTEQHGRGMNPSVIPLALALFGIFGVWFLPLFASGEWKDLFEWPGTPIALIMAFLPAVVLPTTFSVEEGRWGAIWRVSSALPEIGHASVLYPPLCALGGLVLAAAVRACIRNGRTCAGYTLLFTLVGWMITQSFNAQAWQRYCEPIVLMSLVWFVMLSVRPDPEWRGGIRTRWLLPFLLGMLQLGISMMTLYRPVLRDVPEASVSMLEEPHPVADRRAGIRQAKASESIYTAVHGRQ